MILLYPKFIAKEIATKGEVIELYNSPNNILDMQIHIDMLRVLGKQCEIRGNHLKITESDKSLKQELIWHERSIRNTLLIFGALTARFGHARVPIPGGCKLGERKYDLHVMLLEKLGAHVWEENEYLYAEVKHEKLKGAEILLPLRSTGATENGILAGCLAKGTTTIWNPHIRPEIIELIAMLNKMGGDIQIYGQQCIVIEGVEELHGTSHTIIPDNMEAISWAIGSVVTGGDIEIINFPFDHLEVPMIFLRESGMKYYRGKDSLIVKGGRCYPVDISTGPYPGINSDMQPLFAVYGACAQGQSKIVDLRFPGRYGYAYELKKMGMTFTEEGDMLKIKGGNLLTGATVYAIDLRAGIALLLAGLTAEGTTVIENAWQIARGYEFVEEKLKKLGVNLL